MSEWLFYLFGGLAVVSATTVLFAKNILYAAFALVITFLAVAALYVLANAEFVAMTQIMIYVGGIIVLLIFGIMLTNKISGNPLATSAGNRIVGTTIALSLAVILIYAIFKINFAIISAQATAEPINNVNHIGIGLMTDYLLPFEISGIILLAALVGAATIASNKVKSNEH